ncbi:peroxiredoxin-5, mitochondrial-like isoform X2 [Watersipora subatra]|uniref:peroxiredoxin-5, mitochondrial-like isoform X2 n=1 Tax=Watersipora subatra TaxID=2589382 RepID=UPI00355B2412
MIAVGDKIPSVNLQESNPGDNVNIADLFKGKKGVLFAVPGAFTPGCSQTHLPGYVENADEFKKAGAGVIACVSVNDAFVMSEWGKANQTEGKIRMLADTNAEFSKAIGLSKDIPPLGGTRSVRYSMVIDDGVVKFLNVEPDGTGLTCSLAPNLLGQLSKL